MATEDITFKFEIPPLPYPPEINAITTSAAEEGEPTFAVSAEIAASEQKKGICYVNGSPILPPDDPSNYTECEELTAWKQEAHPDISPNPPDIKKVLLYYYMNDDTSTTRSPVTMTYDPVTKLATADVPIESDLVENNTIHFYIVVLDHYGNVSSQVPDTTLAPCAAGGTSWDASLSTPVWETCSQVTQYEECAVVKTGSPGSCSSSYTTNDRLGDTCGEPGSDGKQTLLSPSVDKVDIHGISAGADDTTFCIRMGLGAAPPPTSDSPPIEGYLSVYFNPDIPDSNPGDTHIENAYAITYAPEAQGSDPTLVRVLWDGDCATDPNTEDPLDCKIKSAIPGDPDLQMGYANGALIFITKKSWGSDQLIGSSSKLSQIITLTGEINLSGDTLFWLVDMTNGLGFYHKNTKVTITKPVENPCSAPPTASGECNLGGSTGSGKSTCTNSSSKPPEGNDCVITFQQSLDKNKADKYKIYRSISGSAYAEIAEELNTTATSYTYTDSIGQDYLDGFTRTYKITCLNTDADPGNQESTTGAVTTCAPEDWVPPVAPVGPLGVDDLEGKTPAGNTEKCEIKWSADTVVDSSIAGFYVLRGGSALFDQKLGAVAATGTNYVYSYTDASEDLQNLTTYSYEVQTIDRGENVSDPNASVTCTPEDFKPPSSIDSLEISLIAETLGVDLNWDDSTESDLAGYNTYGCKCINKNIDCMSSGDYTPLNSSMLTSSQHSYIDDVFFVEDKYYCFYAEAMDNCDTAGTCPSNSGTPNSSGFPSSGCPNCADSIYVKTAKVTVVPDECLPAFPGNIYATAPAEGEKCKLTWEKKCENSNPTTAGCETFAKDDTGEIKCSPPESADLSGYKVVKSEDGTVNIPYPNQRPDLIVETVVSTQTVDSATISGLTNGTQYCFIPFSYDTTPNYPTTDNKPATEADLCCTPQDLVAPDEPKMSGMTWSDLPSCTPQWDEISDQNTITFNLYRCTGTAAECASAGSFAAVAGGTGLSETTLTLEDGNVDDGLTYTYAITAKDPSLNESSIIGTDFLKSNMKECMLGKVSPCSSVKTQDFSDKSGCNFEFQASPSDTVPGTYASNEGYSIYLCGSTSATTCTTKISTRSGCAEDAAAGDLIQEVCDDIVTNHYKQRAMAGTHDGVWHAGCTYTDSTGESETTVSTSTCEVGTCDTALEDIITGVMKEVDYEVSGTFTPVAKSGLTVELVDQSDESVIKTGFTGADGKATLSVCPANMAGLTMRLQIRIEEAGSTGMICDATSTGDTTFKSGDCLLYLDENISGDDAGSGYTSNKSFTLPKPGSLAGRKEIGNAKCDDQINFDDFKEIKKAYKKSASDDGYLAWADFNNDDNINFDDFKILKANYKKKVYGTLDTTDASFCKQ